MSPPVEAAAARDARDPSARVASRVRRRRGGFLAELAATAVIAVVSLGLGILFNQWRAKPLPWVYQTRGQRLHLAAEKLAAGQGVVSPSPEAADATHEIRLEEFQPFVSERRGLVLDARPAVFYAQGHVPGAVSLPRETFDEDYPRQQQALEAYKDREVAIYCSGADCPDSQLLSEALTRLGYRRLLIYTSGWDEWSQTGLPQEGAPTP